MHRGELLAYITSDRIKSNAQLDGALDYLGKVGSGVGGCGAGRQVEASTARRRRGSHRCHGRAACWPALWQTSAPRRPRACPPSPAQVGSEAIDVAAFEEAAGVGVEVGPEQVKAAVAACVAASEAQLREERCAAGARSGARMARCRRWRRALRICA